MAHKTGKRTVRATPRGAGTKVHGKGAKNGGQHKSIKSGAKQMDPSVTTRMFT